MICPSCGTAASGNFCSSCGASLMTRACAACRVELSPQARFCHRCGQPVSGSGPATAASERKAWMVAGALCLLLVGGIVYKVSSASPQPVAPDMANAGASRSGPGPGHQQPESSRAVRPTVQPHHASGRAGRLGSGGPVHPDGLGRVRSAGNTGRRRPLPRSGNSSPVRRDVGRGGPGRHHPD